MISNNYECEGQMRLEDMIEKPEQKLKQGTIVYKVNQGEVNEVEVKGNAYWAEHQRTWFYHVRDSEGYGDTISEKEIGENVFFDRKEAEQKAEEYIREHDVIRAEDIHPVKTVAFQYTSKYTGNKMKAFYSELDNGMVYVKGFHTFAHLQKTENKMKAIQEFREQQEFRYEKIEQIKYEPEFKNMYRIKMKYDWDYAEAGHSYAVG